jgi:hypothetical protein
VKFENTTRYLVLLLSSVWPLIYLSFKEQQTGRPAMGGAGGSAPGAYGGKDPHDVGAGGCCSGCVVL